MSTTSTGVLWLVTRVPVVLLLIGPHAWVTGDIGYFAGSLGRVADDGMARTLVEYPLPGVALVAFPWFVAESVGHPDLYAGLVMVLAASTDAAFTALLRRNDTSRRSLATWVWLLAVPLLGATTYARFDLVPGILAGVAVLVLASHPRLAAAAAAVATGLKLWPALLLPAITAPRGNRWSTVTVVAVIGSLLAGTSVLLGGWQRLLSPLSWQADRGLQIESVLATPAMVGWVFRPDAYAVAYSDHNAFEVGGPGVHGLLAASSALALFGGLLLAAFWMLAWKRGGSVTPDTVVWLCLAAVTGFVLTSKVLSPQYLLWLLPASAAGLAVVRTRRAHRQLRRWALLLLLATAVTQLIFPTFYGGLTRHGASSPWVVLLLVVRNSLLGWLTLRAVAEAWWHLQRSPQRGKPLDRQPLGPGVRAVRSLR